MPVISTLPPSRGSSPLTRGKLSRDEEGDLPEGLIPAHAGKTLLMTSG